LRGLATITARIMITPRAINCWLNSSPIRIRPLLIKPIISAPTLYCRALMRIEKCSGRAGAWRWARHCRSSIIFSLRPMACGGNKVAGERSIFPKLCADYENHFQRNGWNKGSLDECDSSLGENVLSAQDQTFDSGDLQEKISFIFPCAPEIPRHFGRMEASSLSPRAPAWLRLSLNCRGVMHYKNRWVLLLRGALSMGRDKMKTFALSRHPSPAIFSLLLKVSEQCALWLPWGT
jgi:hypothetical protein